MIILDTDALTIVQRRTGDDYRRVVHRLDAADEPVCVAIISFEEQLRGWMAFVSKARTPARLIRGYTALRMLLEDFQTRPVIDYDQSVDAEYCRLVGLKLRLGTMDLRIAATAIASDALLVSRNLSDFRRVPGLRVEDWTA